MNAADERAPGAVRLLIVALNPPCEPIGVGRYTGELAADLAARGHQVELIAGPPHYPDWRVPAGWRGWRYRRRRHGAARVLQCPARVPRAPTAAGRLGLHLSFALAALPAALWRARRARPDVVLAVAPALLCAPVAWLAARLAGAPAWLHLHDLEMDAARAHGLLRGWAVHALAGAFERWTLRGFDTVTTVSEPLRRALRAKGVPAGRLAVLANWVDTEALRPAPDPRAGRAGFGLPADRPVALYAGSLGRKQGLQVLVDAARRLAETSDVRIAVFGAGPMAEPLRRRARELPNLQVGGLVPEADLSALLGCADLHLLPQARPGEELALPSKLAAMLASGRPVIAAAAPGTAVAQLVADCGIALPANDGAGFAAAIGELCADPAARARLGAAARARACARLDRGTLLDRFEDTLRALARSGRAANRAGGPRRHTRSEPE